MPVVLAGVFLFNIGTFAHKPFEILGRTRTMVVVAFIAAAINLAMCFALVPLLGYAGAAWATLLAYLSYTVVGRALGRRLIASHLNRRRVSCVEGAVVVLGLRSHRGGPVGHAPALRRRPGRDRARLVAGGGSPALATRPTAAALTLKEVAK